MQRTQGRIFWGSTGMYLACSKRGGVIVKRREVKEAQHSLVKENVQGVGETRDRGQGTVCVGKRRYLTTEIQDLTFSCENCRCGGGDLGNLKWCHLSLCGEVWSAS